MALNPNIDVNFKINLIGLVLGFIVIVSENIDVLAQRRHSSRHSRRRWEDGSIRLVGGRTENEGTVLIYHWSRWGAICDDYWDIRDAHVVCNELGFPGASAAPRESMFGKGRRRVWFSGLHCRGHERHLTMCYSRGWGNSLRRCRGYWTSAGVICNPKTTTTTNRRSTRRQRTTTTTSTPTTPSTTTTTNKPATALAITRLPTTWVTAPTPTLKPTTRSTTTTTSKPTTTTTTPIPTTTTTLKPTTSTPASTATRRTTTTTKPKPTTKTTTTQQPTIVTTTRKPTTKQKVPTTKSTRRPRTTALITTTTPIQATTTATPPREYNRWIYNSELWRYFMYFSDGTHVTSRPDPRYFQRRGRSSSSSSTTTTATTTTSTTTTTTTPAPAVVDSIYNIIGGEDEHAAVDDYTRGNNNDIDNNINHLLPQTIDTEGNHVPETSYHHHHHNQIKEGYLADAPHTDNIPDTQGTVEEVEAVPDDDDDKVTQAPEVPDYTEYRLAGGRVYSSFKEGRLEVRLAGSNEWGVVCGDNWDFRAAIVTCKHLGVGFARTAQTTAHYGGSDMDKVVANIKCKGSEERLEDCDIELTQNHPGHEVCSKASSVAGVICDSRLPDLTPNVTRLEQSAYLQNRYLYYLQCAFEEGCLSSSADALYKTNSWTQMTRQLLRFSTIAHNIGTADFRPDVDRSKWEWHACHQHYHSMESFSHYDIIDKHGNRVAEGLKASFCLEDSECNRGSQPKYNCQNWGQQGIAVGCADAYLADIDCQWIDVTDVKPGFYTLKVELNPNMLVPELSYDNNVAVCDLYFNTVSARLYNCKSGGLL